VVSKHLLLESVVSCPT